MNTQNSGTELYHHLTHQTPIGSKLNKFLNGQCVNKSPLYLVGFKSNGDAIIENSYDGKHYILNSSVFNTLIIYKIYKPNPIILYLKNLFKKFFKS